MKTLTVKRDRVGDWFVIVVTELPDPEPRPEPEPEKEKEIVSALGVDLGLKNLVVLSSGEHVGAPKLLGKSEKKLIRAQKKLSRKRLGSRNRAKARLRLAKTHRKIGRQRDDFLHKLSRVLVKKADLLVFEDLQVQNMVKNHCLSKSIMDASWGKLVGFASYKALSGGKKVVLVDPRGTTQQCSRCGWINLDMKLSDRVFICQSCGLVVDRDLNAALNILTLGLIKVGR